MRVVTELAINFGVGLGMILAVALSVFLFACGHSWVTNDLNSPRWMKVVGALTILLPAITLLGFCMRMPT